MNKILAMMNRKGYRHERVSNSKLPYLLIFIILVLLYIMRNIYDDNKSLYIDKEMLEYEMLELDSVKQILESKNSKLYKKLDSIKTTKPIVKPVYKRRKEVPVEKMATKPPAIETADTIN